MHRRRKRRAVAGAAAIIIMTVAPARIGHPDLNPPAATPPTTRSGFRAHFLASPFGTIHEPTFRFSQPVGTDIPAGLHLAAYGADSSAMLSRPDGGEDWHREFPHIDRTLKGPRLVPRVTHFEAPQPATADGSIAEREPAAPSPAGPPAPAADATGETMPDRAAPPDTGLSEDDGDLMRPEASDGETVEPAEGDAAAFRMARIYFAIAAPGVSPAALEPWPDEGPGPGPQESSEASRSEESPASHAPSRPTGNETIATKGEVTGAGHRPKSPAELLDLTGAARARHERCLANAIYFEARGEPVRGQMAVAQVVINRVLSGYYPSNICGVVYQSTRRHRHRRCQFSFTCDGIPDRVTEPDAWDRAKQIARDALDGNFWLNDIGKATHYHARWVHPWWVHEMRRLDRIGVHTFYRPRRWGDGADSPVWGDATAKL